MSCYAIKSQQIKKEIEKYIIYDWKAFGNLTFEEKVAEYLKLVEMLIYRRDSWSFYFHTFSNIVNDDNDEKRLKHVGKKLVILRRLITILQNLVYKMDVEISLSEQESKIDH